MDDYRKVCLEAYADTQARMRTQSRLLREQARLVREAAALARSISQLTRFDAHLTRQRSREIVMMGPAPRFFARAFPDEP